MRRERVSGFPGYTRTARDGDSAAARRYGVAAEGVAGRPRVPGEPHRAARAMRRRLVATWRARQLGSARALTSTKAMIRPARHDVDFAALDTNRRGENAVALGHSMSAATDSALRPKRCAPARRRCPFRGGSRARRAGPRGHGARRRRAVAAGRLAGDHRRGVPHRQRGERRDEARRARPGHRPAPRWPVDHDDLAPRRLRAAYSAASPSALPRRTSSTSRQLARHRGRPGPEHGARSASVSARRRALRRT